MEFVSPAAGISNLDRTPAGGIQHSQHKVQTHDVPLKEKLCAKQESGTTQQGLQQDSVAINGAVPRSSMLEQRARSVAQAYA